MRKKETGVDSVVEMLKEKLGYDANISVEYTDDIPVLASGKRKPVINNWKNGKSAIICFGSGT